MRAFNLPERRLMRRMYVKVPLTCGVMDVGTNVLKIHAAITGDISETGIYFETREVIPVRSEIKLSFQLPHSELQVSTTARVVRVDVSSDEKIFCIGANFTEISEAAVREIRRFIERLDIGKIFVLAIQKGASDVHLIAGYPPVLRIHGELQRSEFPELHPDDIGNLIFSILTKQQIHKFEVFKELDFGLQHDVQHRFRINLHLQRGFMEATLRRINTRTYSFQELNIPDAVKDLARLRDGLILVTGPTGSGKSTTIAAMVDLVNHERKAVIITLERPIEYIYENDKSIIKQREIGVDSNSFSIALQSSLRQDPNVIVVGELEDVETIKTAMTAAEAGYLVIASFHAPNTIQAIDRLTSYFPMESRKHILGQLSNCLKGVITQLLIPSIDRSQRVLASEVLVVTEAVRRIVRSDDLVQISTVIQTGARYKMQAMADAIKKYVDLGLIDFETARFYSQEFGVY